MGSQRTPDFDRPVARTGDDLSPIIVKAHREDPIAVGVGLLRLEIQRNCQGRQKWSDLAKERRFEASGAPESHTLIVLSYDPETILLPSGEKSTEEITLLCAFAFSARRLREPARGARRRQFR